MQLTLRTFFMIQACLYDRGEHVDGNGRPSAKWARRIFSLTVNIGMIFSDFVKIYLGARDNWMRKPQNSEIEILTNGEN